MADKKAAKMAALRAKTGQPTYQGRPVPLNKPMPGDVKKYKVFVRNDDGRVVKVNFGDPNMEIKRDDPERRSNFRARHRCDADPAHIDEPRYWACKFWEAGQSVSDLTGKSRYSKIKSKMGKK